MPVLWRGDCETFSRVRPQQHFRDFQGSFRGFKFSQVARRDYQTAPAVDSSDPLAFILRRRAWRAFRAWRYDLTARRQYLRGLAEDVSGPAIPETAMPEVTGRRPWLAFWRAAREGYFTQPATDLDDATTTTVSVPRRPWPTFSRAARQSYFTQPATDTGAGGASYIPTWRPRRR